MTRQSNANRILEIAKTIDEGAILEKRYDMIDAMHRVRLSNGCLVNFHIFMKLNEEVITDAVKRGLRKSKSDFIEDEIEKIISYFFPEDADTEERDKMMLQIKHCLTANKII